MYDFVEVVGRFSVAVTSACDEDAQFHFSWQVQDCVCMLHCVVTKTCCEFLMTHIYGAILHDVTCRENATLPFSDESNFHFAWQVKGMKPDVQLWMIRGDQPRVDLVGSPKDCG